ncbi:MAG: hypothetical protein AAFX93_00460 [Verrucomicrobiota bacterium]
MNFPLKPEPDSTQIPSRAYCLVCEERIGEVHGFVRLTAGAILHEDETKMNGGLSSLMDTVFSLWYHGPHPSKKREDGKFEITSMDNAEHSMDIVAPTGCGQVDIHFCSSKCLKDFFGALVDSFESGISTANSEYERRKVEPGGR